MKVSLISTSLIDLGLRSISSYLNKEGHTTQLLNLDCSRKTYSKSILSQLTKLCADSDLIGISGIYITRSKTDQITKELSNKRIIFGGYDATLDPEFYLSKGGWVCKGDGEYVISNLVRLLEKGPLPNKGILPLEGVDNLNRLPSENYNLKDQFVLNNSGKIVLAKKLPVYKHPRGETKDGLFYIASRGCPNFCSFCQEPDYYKETTGFSKIRIKEPEKVIDDLEKIMSEHTCLRKIYFVDPDFFAKPLRWFNDFSKLYEKEIGLPFFAWGHAKTIEKDKLNILIRLGLENIAIGIQSGSEDVKEETYNRRESNEEVINCINLLHDFGIDKPWVDIIFDNPYETRKDLLETIELIKNIPKPTELGCFGLEFLPGTPLTNQAKKDGISIENISSKMPNLRGVLREGPNTYLNIVIKLMMGECTERRLGNISLDTLPVLLDNKIIEFMESNPQFPKTLNEILYK